MNTFSGPALALTLLIGTNPLLAAGGDSIDQGNQIYQQFCQRCHGFELRSSGVSTFDLRKFPANDKSRFLQSVSKGKGDMPPHDDILLPEEIEALFDYVTAMQKQITP